MSKSVSSHSLNSTVPHPSSPSGNINNSNSLLDDDLISSPGQNLDLFSLDAPNAFGQAVSNDNNSFNAAGSNLVLYSSDVNIAHAHVPEVIMAAGGHSGSAGGGTTTTG